MNGACKENYTMMEAKLWPTKVCESVTLDATTENDQTHGKYWMPAKDLYTVDL
jgi:hypothetical protein